MQLYKSRVIQNFEPAVKWSLFTFRATYVKNVFSLAIAKVMNYELFFHLICVIPLIKVSSIIKIPKRFVGQKRAIENAIHSLKYTLSKIL